VLGVYADKVTDWSEFTRRYEALFQIMAAAKTEGCRGRADPCDRRFR
jgi:hypothetical protein